MSGLVGACRHHIAIVVKKHRMDAWHAWSSAARLHRRQARHGAENEAAGFCLPVGIDDGRAVVANLFVIPTPNLRLNRLANRAYQFEFEIVFLRFVRPDLTQRPNGGRRGVEDRDAQVLGNPPAPSSVRIGRHAFIDDRRGAE
jgi:hypothetical protein